MFNNLMQNLPYNTIWAMALIVVSIAFSLQFACGVPLIALAVMGILTLPTRTAFATVVAAWLCNQLIGYTILGYPIELMSFVWGGIIGLSAIASFLTCYIIARKLPHASFWSKAVIMFIAGFVVYESTMYLAAILLQDSTENFTLEIAGQILAVNAMCMAGLLIIHRISTRLGIQPVCSNTA